MIAPRVLSLLAAAPPSALDPHGSEAKTLSNVWWIMFGLAVGVYLIVGGFIIVATLRGRRAAVEGEADETRHDRAFILIGGIIVPTVILLFLGFLTVHTGAALRKPGRQPLQVSVAGEDWWWSVRYPGTNIVTANELHLPVGQRIEIRLTSDNVIHSFWVPQLAGKEDVVPGQPNTLSFTIDKTGTYRGFCAEYCGIQHANMGFRVIAQTPGAFAKWLAHEQQIQPMPTSDLQEAGQVAFTTAACAGCHTVRGTDAKGVQGPNLTDVGSRATLGAETIDNTPQNMQRWIEDPQHFKPGSLMPPATISNADIRAITAYLESLG